jgi:hypothetical protein
MTILPVAHIDDTPAIASMMLSSPISIEDVLGLAVTRTREANGPIVER